MRPVEHSLSKQSDLLALGFDFFSGKGKLMMTHGEKKEKKVKSLNFNKYKFFRFLLHCIGTPKHD